MMDVLKTYPFGRINKARSIDSLYSVAISLICQWLKGWNRSFFVDPDNWKKIQDVNHHRLAVCKIVKFSRHIHAAFYGWPPKWSTAATASSCNLFKSRFRLRVDNKNSSTENIFSVNSLTSTSLNNKKHTPVFMDKNKCSWNLPGFHPNFHLKSLFSS